MTAIVMVHGRMVDTNFGLIRKELRSFHKETPLISFVGNWKPLIDFLNMKGKNET